MIIKFSELLSQNEIDSMYLMTIINPIRRQEIKRLLVEMRLIDTQN